MLTLAIQAGGNSRRMGKDKALLSFHGIPLIQHILNRLSPIADEIIITTNNPQAYRFLDVRLARDLRLGRGALGGLYTALSTAKHNLVAVVACDMPFASPQVFLTARKLLLTHEADAVIPKTQHGYEPLHALYRRDACIPPIKNALDNNKWKMISWFEQVKVYDLKVKNEAIFKNLNTPEDFIKAEKLSEPIV